MAKKTKKVIVSVYFRGRSKWAVVDAIWDGDHAYVDPQILDDLATSIGVKRGQTYTIA